MVLSRVRGSIRMDAAFRVIYVVTGYMRTGTSMMMQCLQAGGLEAVYSPAREGMNERHGEGNWHLENSSTAVTSDGTRWNYGGTPSTEPPRPYGIPQNGLTRATVEWEDGVSEQKRLSSNTLLVTRWSYEGLHLLKDGDHLTIYHPDNNNEVWSGVIALKQHPLFTEDASGLWIHADQIGMDREVWAEYFFKGYHAKLKQKPPTKSDN